MKLTHLLFFITLISLSANAQTECTNLRSPQKTDASPVDIYKSDLQALFRNNVAAFRFCQERYLKESGKQENFYVGDLGIKITVDQTGKMKATPKSPEEIIKTADDIEQARGQLFL